MLLGLAPQHNYNEYDRQSKPANLMPASFPQMETTRWVALGLVPRLGGRTFSRLLAHFGSAEAILAADVATLQTVRGVGPKLAEAIGAVDVARVQIELRAWQQAGITVLTRAEAAYPSALRGEDAPPVLFLRGAHTLPAARGVALVGTRRPQAAARRYAHDLAYALAAAGHWVVSGLALGIDAAAHQGALDADGDTLAVLGGGVNVPYPPQNRALFNVLAREGALLSEHHPQTMPSAAFLVARNRLIAALSWALVVVETGTEGGSWHTVRFARARGVPVFAVRSRAAGNRRLLAEGARPLPPDASAACARLLSAYATLALP